jgi:hypothetical protein
MKKLLATLALFIFISTGSIVFSQPPPPPPNPDLVSSGPVGGSQSGAPVGDGVWILLALSMAYAGRKVYAQYRKVPV